MRRDTFKVATWNMGGGEERGGPTPDQADRVLTRLERMGCSVVLGQEAQEANDREALRDLGYRVHRAQPETLVAWQPGLWTPVLLDEVVLNPTSPFFRKGGDKPIYVTAARAILCSNWGQSVECLSYHTPSSVQPLAQAPENREAALRESMDTMAELADDSLATAVLFGGDDNVDERHGSWPFMLEVETGLRQVVAPGNTLGRRRVDDFRVRDLVVMAGTVVEGPTHHNAHARKMRFR